MSRLLSTLVVLALVLSLHPGLANASGRGIKAETETHTGDLDAILKRRIIRVAVPYSRTLFFTDKGHQRGILGDGMREFERDLRKAYPGKRPFTVVITPMTFDRLIPSVVEGKADLAAGRITVTEDRLKVVDFTAPSAAALKEIVVTGPGAPQITNLDDLSGKEVYVCPATSYFQSLKALNDRFAAQGKAPVNIVALPNELQNEDVLDMLNAGLISITVVDDVLVRLWKDFLPHITPRTDLVMRDDGVWAWAIRKDSPKLKALLDATLAQYSGKGLQKYLINKFADNAKRMRNARNDEDMRRFDSLVSVFRKYGDQYGFDHLLLIAQGYQESTLDQNVKSPVGAVGVMQIMPTTGKTLNVGDIRQVDANIHGGSKYVAMLMDEYFKDASFDVTNRTLFAFASYNAGAARIARMRKIAQEEGLDPNLWFNNVEEVVARRVGQEPVQYVRNIFKYYVAYKLEEDARAQREKAMKGVQ